MIRTLFIIAGAALVLCVVTVGGALAIGGADLQRHGWAWTFKDNDGESIRFERVQADDADKLGPQTTRTLSWTGGERLVIDSPGEIIFIQGDEAKVELSGPESVVNRTRLVDGRLSVDDLVQSSSSQEFEVGVLSMNGSSKTYAPSTGLRVTITAPNVRQFEVNARADLSIRSYDLPSLILRLSGSGDVEVEGRADSVEADLSGSGDVDLSDLVHRDAKFTVSGSGSVRAGPTNKADIALSGSGDVDLTQRPATLTQRVTGSGDIRQDW